MVKESECSERTLGEFPGECSALGGLGAGTATSASQPAPATLTVTSEPPPHPVFTGWSSSSKAPQTGMKKQTCHLTVLEATSVTGQFLPRAGRQDLFHASARPLADGGHLGLSLACECIMPVCLSSPGVLSLCLNIPCSKDTHHSGLGPTLLQHSSS